MLDPTDPVFAADPYGAYARLRDTHPVWRWPHDGTYLLTRYADVHAAWRDRRFGSDYAGRLDADATRAAEAAEPWRGAGYPRFAAYARWDLIAMEPPDHTKLRRLVTEAFTSRAIEGQRRRAEAFVVERLAAAASSGGIDVVRDLAEPLSLTVICDLIGVPASERERVLALSHRVVQMYEPGATDAQRADADRAVGEFEAVVRALIAHRRRRPGNDLLSGLLDALVDGERLSDAQVSSVAMLLLMAGHEASVSAAANAVAALAAHPAEWAALRSGAVGTAVAAEEVLRWDPPLQLFRRWVLEEGVEIAGVAIPRGARIGLLIGSANRDPRRFPEPDVFRIARGDAAHLAFGGGIHFCLGAPLARLELQALLDVLVARVPELALGEGVRRRPGFQFRGYAALPLRLSRSA